MLCTDIRIQIDHNTEQESVRTIARAHPLDESVEMEERVLNKKEICISTTHVTQQDIVRTFVDA